MAISDALDSKRWRDQGSDVVFSVPISMSTKAIDLPRFLKGKPQVDVEWHADGGGSFVTDFIYNWKYDAQSLLSEIQKEWPGAVRETSKESQVHISGISRHLPFRGLSQQNIDILTGKLNGSWCWVEGSSPSELILDPHWVLVVYSETREYWPPLGAMP